VPGARSRQIQSLYIENEEGERFKYPMTHLAGARAMQRHVSNGGRPHDEFGQHIVSTSEDIAKLNSFSRYVTNKDQLNDNAGDIIEQTKLKLENLRGYMKNIAKQSHYEAASKDFKTADEQVLDDETVAKLREKFTLTNLDNRVEDALPLINRIMSEYDDEDQMKIKDTQPTVIPKDTDPIKAEPEPQVDHGAIVQSFLTDPESKLILRKDTSADKMLSATKFKDKSTMLGAILSDIASRMLTKTGEEDRVANFASRVADGIESEGSAMFKPGPDYNSNKKIAVQLAKRYIDDYKKMQSDPEYGKEVRMDPEDYNPKKHPKLDKRARGEATEFEEWAEGVANEYAVAPRDEEDRKEKLKALQDLQSNPKLNDPETTDAIKKRKQELTQKEENQLEGLTFEDIKPYVSMYTDKDGKKVNAVLDKDGEEVFKTHDAKAAMAYLSQNYDKLKKEDNAPDMVIRDPDDEAEDKEQEIAKDQEEAEKINTELDRIKQLANI